MRHILVMSSTASLGFILLFVVDLVDMFFISLLGNTELAAAIGFSGSILFFTTSVGIGISIAAGALIARELGSDNVQRARDYLTHVLIWGALVAIVLASLVWFNLITITGWLGARGNVQAAAVSYLQIIIPSMPILMLGMVASAALRGHGAAVLSTLVTATAGLVNAILDPIFIFGLDLGLEGAAWASVGARFAMVVVAFWPIFSRYGGLSKLRWPTLSADTGAIFAIALPAILANIAAPVGGAYVTYAMAQFGESAVAGMAVIGRVTPIAFALIFAMSMAIGPIIGQNFGANQHDRVALALRESIIFICIYVIFIVLLLIVLRAPIANLFQLSGIGRDLLWLFCGPLSLAWIFNGIIFVSNAAFNNLGHPFYSTWINWGRNTLGIIPFSALGAYYGGAKGVLIGQMAGGVLFGLICLWLAAKVVRIATELEREQLKKPAFHGHRRALAIQHTRRE